MRWVNVWWGIAWLRRRGTALQRRTVPADLRRLSDHIKRDIGLR